MKQFQLVAEKRLDTGTSVCRRLRATGRVPGVLYGAGSDNMAISLDSIATMRCLSQEAFYSNVLTLMIDDKEEAVVLKDVAHHPTRPQILHIDFLRVDENKPITVSVPIHFINEDRCVGVKQGGGIASHILTEVEVYCLPKHLPEYIEVDVGDLSIGETVHLGDLTLPENVELYSLKHGGAPDQPVVSVYVPKVTQEEETEAQPETPEGESSEEKEEGT